MDICHVRRPSVACPKVKCSFVSQVRDKFPTSRPPASICLRYPIRFYLVVSIDPVAKFTAANRKSTFFVLSPVSAI